MIQNSDFWPVHTDLDFLGPFYFAKNVLLSVRKITLSDHLPYEIFVRPSSFVIFFLFDPRFHTFSTGYTKLFIV